MAKKILLALLFCAQCTFFSSLFASTATALPEKISFNGDVCNAPAPDSFRITSLGSSFISLAWHPAWVGAIHTIAVLEKNSSGGWTSLITLNSIPGSEYTVDSLASGQEYRFIIATNCSSGQPSESKAIVDGIALILDLSIEGRTPVKPVAVPCSQIPLNQNWIGFKVDYAFEGITLSNTFEIVVLDGGATTNNTFSHAVIKRVSLNHPIVAVDPEGFWPTCEFPIRFDVGSSFRMDRLVGGGPEREMIGYVTFTESTNPPTISLCPDYNNLDLPWKSAYTLTGLKAGKVIPPSVCNPEVENRSALYGSIKVQSPFGEILNVFLPQSKSSYDKTTLRLFNSNGQKVMEHYFETLTSQISLPVHLLSTGFYILQIESESEVEIFKVFKSI